jgi:hypothetical protein
MTRLPRQKGTAVKAKVNEMSGQRPIRQSEINGQVIEATLIGH